MNETIICMKGTWRSWIYASWYNYENNQQDELFLILIDPSIVVWFSRDSQQDATL
jgi:hypothetical protein